MRCSLSMERLTLFLDSPSRSNSAITAFHRAAPWVRHGPYSTQDNSNLRRSLPSRIFSACNTKETVFSVVSLGNNRLGTTAVQRDYQAASVTDSGLANAMAGL